MQVKWRAKLILLSKGFLEFLRDVFIFKKFFNGIGQHDIRLLCKNIFGKQNMLHRITTLDGCIIKYLAFDQIRRMAQCAFSAAIGTAPHILWQNILDTQVNVSYTADNEKQTLINLLLSI